MFPWSRPAPSRDQEAGDRAREVLNRAIGLLKRYQRAGAAELPVADILEMLGAAPESGPPPAAQHRDPRADPMTGCAPVTPPPPPR